MDTKERPPNVRCPLLRTQRAVASQPSQGDRVPIALTVGRAPISTGRLLRGRHRAAAHQPVFDDAKKRLARRR